MEMSKELPRIVPNSENTLIEAKVSDMTTEFVSVDVVDAANALPAECRHRSGRGPATSTTPDL